MSARIPIVVDSRIRLPYDRLVDAADERLRAAFEHANPQYGKKLGEPESYATWSLDVGANDFSVPRGGMRRVREALRASGYAWDVEDRRTWENPEPGFPDHLLTERPYQERMRKAAEERENCLLHGATGSGKTCVAYSLLARLKRRSLVMVWTESLLKQWRDRAVSELGMRPSDVGVVQGTRERIEPLTIAMQQTVASRFAAGDRSLAGAFDVVLCDEVQRMAAETCYAAVDPFSARFRVGVSADHTRKDEKEFLIRDLFGDVAEEITEEETIAAGATVDVEVCLVPTSFRYRPNYANPQWWRYLVDAIVEDEERNALALRIAAKTAQEGEQVLLFTHRVEHARTIASRLVGLGVRAGALVGGAENAAAFDRAVSGFRSGDFRAGVGTYQAIAQGLDLPSVSRGICLTPVSNNRQQLGQVRGRICRSSDGKDFGRLIYLVDPLFGKKPARNFVEWFRTVKVWQGGEWVDARQWLSSRG